jgi:Ran GTPase-activating protein (RanGAP) involved in mRNA processing and transport
MVAIARGVANNAVLECLSLAFNDITDTLPTKNGKQPISQVKDFLMNSNLRSLDLRGNFIREESAVKLVELMRERKQLHGTELRVMIAESISNPTFLQALTLAGAAKKSSKKSKKPKKKK